jgi:hypothetical protein
MEPAAIRYVERSCTVLGTQGPEAAVHHYVQQSKRCNQETSFIFRPLLRLRNECTLYMPQREMLGHKLHMRSKVFKYRWTALPTITIQLADFNNDRTE